MQFDYITLDWESIRWSLMMAYGVLILCVIGIVISENRNPLKALGWIMALLLFPVGGIILYFIFGRSIRNVRMISRRNRRRLLKLENTLPLPKLDKGLSAENRQRIRLAYNIGGANLYTGNQIKIFNNGERHFEELFDDLRHARSYINLQFYIIANDSLGRRLRDILVERAQAGVKVRVIYDYIGSFDARRLDFFRRMKENGVEVHSFFRLSFPSHVNRVNWRNHRKVVVIDGNVGYIGGMNVADRYVRGTAGENGVILRQGYLGRVWRLCSIILLSIGSLWASHCCVIRCREYLTESKTACGESRCRCLLPVRMIVGAI